MIDSVSFFFHHKKEGAESIVDQNGMKSGFNSLHDVKANGQTVSGL